MRPPPTYVQVADPDGGMLLRDWEAAATALANAPTSEAFAEVSPHVPRGELFQL